MGSVMRRLRKQTGEIERRKHVRAEAATKLNLERAERKAAHAKSEADAPGIIKRVIRALTGRAA